jgi:nucleoside-diphosphate-sugar epimerase
MRCLVYVADVVQGLILALERERAVGQAYNIANDRPLTQQGFLQAVAQEIGVKSPRFHVPYHALSMPQPVPRSVSRWAHTHIHRRL